MISVTYLDASALSRRQVLQVRRRRVRLPRPRRDARPGRGAAPADKAAPSPLAPKTPHFTAEGEADHLPVHGGGDLADGHLRVQAAAPEGRRQARPRRRHADRVEVQVPPARPDRHLGLRAAARTSPSTPTSSACSAACTPTRRPTRRRSSSCTPAAPTPRSPGRRWAPGCCTAWAPRTRTCPATSPSTRRRTSAGR